MGDRGTTQPVPTTKADVIKQLEQADARRRHARDTNDAEALAVADHDIDELLLLLQDFMAVEHLETHAA